MRKVDETVIRNWSCARVKLTVKTPDKKVNGRIKKLRRDKAGFENLHRTPYVKVEWINNESGERSSLVALVDTGADWSLMKESEMSEEERDELQPTDMVGQGVTKQRIEIIGEIWRTIVIGGVEVPQQRFIVVQDMVTPVILGADFWARFGEFAIDFQRRKLKVQSLNLSVDLFDSVDDCRTGGKGCSQRDKNVAVFCSRETKIPPFSEILIRGKLSGGTYDEGSEVLIEPTRDDNDLFGTPYCISTVRGGHTFVKMANVGDEEVLLEEGTVIGKVAKSFTVSNVGAMRTNGRGTNAKGKDIDIDRMCGKQLSKQQKSEMKSLLYEYQDVFYNGGELPSVTIGVEHSIRLKKDAAPVAFRPRRLSPDEETEVREEITSLKKMGVVRESNSPWAAPIVCARKSDGKLRLAIDYRGINNISLPATLHPIPRMDDLFDRLGEANYFSVLDAKSGYHQMPLVKGEGELTAFVVPWGQYEYLDRTPFGLKGAGYSFQRFMSKILGECNFVEALCYLDDILVWGRTWEEHQERLRNVLEKIQSANLKLGAAKCSFGVLEVEYLGTTVKNGMLRVSEQRVETLRQLPRPNTITELRSALGAFSFIQRWLPGLAEASRPLYEAIKGSGRKPLVWTEEMTGSFGKLKELTARAVALRIPDLNKPFTLVTDGSDKGVGSLLAQSEGEMLIPVAFYHHALTEAEKRYNTTDKELLAVVLSIKKFRVYLGRPFTLITDHRAIKFLDTMDMNDEIGRRGRWIEILQQYDMERVYRSGKSYELSVADYLSRVDRGGKVSGEGQVVVVRTAEKGKVVPERIVDLDKLKDLQGKDELIARWKNRILNQGTDCVSVEKKDQQLVNRMVVDGEGVLRILVSGGRRNKQRPFGVRERHCVIVPDSMRADVMNLVHDSPVGGHMGFKRTLRRCGETFWWKGMRIDVEAHIKGCERCGKNKHVNHPNLAPLQLTDIPERVFDRLQVDFLGPFPPSTAHPYRYALQIQDILSRFVAMVPTERNDAETAAEVLFEEWICRYGPSKVIQSDRGTHFTSQVFQKTCHLAGIQHRMGAPGHAESQGQVERQNQLMQQVRALAGNDVDKWPQAMLRVVYAHNGHENETTRLSPYQMVFGTAARTMEGVFMERGMIKEQDKEEETQKAECGGLQAVKEDLAQQAATATLEAQKLRSEESCRRGAQYVVGDCVRIKLSTSERGRLGGKKMAPVFSDVYIVKEVLGGGWTYLLTPANGVLKDKVRHFNNLRKAETGKAEEEVDEYTVIRTEPDRAETSKRKENDTKEQGVSRTKQPEAMVPKGRREKKEKKYVIPQRSSSRKKVVTKKLVIDWSKKKYEEKEVMLTEDMGSQGALEDMITDEEEDRVDQEGSQ